MKTIRVLFFGDIIGVPGRTIFQKYVALLKNKYHIDAIIVNGENSSTQGRGITSRIVQFFKHNGVNVVTSGNHIWYHREIYEYLRTAKDLLRPENYPTACPGTGITTFDVNGITIGVLQLQGRIFMKEHLECPFKTADSALTYLKTKTNIIIVDIHAEATSEKSGIGWYLDGRVSAIFGTHTHIQTADERILPKGTAFIADAGMSGALNSMIGMQKEPIIQHFLTQMPTKFLVETHGPFLTCGAWVEIDVDSGKALKIERFRIIDEELVCEKMSD